MDKRKTVKIISTLFSAYGQANDGNRIAVYTEMLADMPPALLQASCKKLMATSHFLPAIADIIDAAKSLNAEASGERVKTWAEAQKEIAAGITRTWYKGCLGEEVSDDEYGKPCAPIWSTPEIAAAVDSYGFDNLCRALESDMPIVWAQLRKAYEATTTRKAEKAINEPLIAEFKLITQNVKLLK